MKTGIIGWYYLHENGDLIYKRELGGTVADLRESSFVKGIWPFDPSDRAGAWNILVEGLASGARAERVRELAERWGCDDADAVHYADYVTATLYPDGAAICATPFWFTDLQESPAGFGDDALEALAELCKNLGYKPTKIWGTTFKKLLEDTQ
jgi:hypothetical protein